MAALLANAIVWVVMVAGLMAFTAVRQEAGIETVDSVGVGAGAVLTQQAIGSGMPGH